MGGLGRRGFLGAVACGYAACRVSRARADETQRVSGPGYSLAFVGAQRDTISNGKLAAALDIRTLGGRPDLIGVGPLAQLRGEVTIIDGRPSLARVGPDGRLWVEPSFEAGAPFFVWAEVPAWQ